MYEANNVELVNKIQKTKYMTLSRNNQDNNQLKIRNIEFKNSRKFKYLGCILINQNTLVKEIFQRSRNAIFSLKTI